MELLTVTRIQYTKDECEHKANAKKRKKNETDPVIDRGISYKTHEIK